jgi:uncharacterized protein (TIGR02271 family)
MAKTLVGLYDHFTDAESVVQELVQSGFLRSDVWLTTHNGNGRTASGSHVAGTLPEDREDLMNTLTDYGVPVDEASSYTEGVRRGGTLVVVKTSDELADRGMDIMNRLHPVDLHDRIPQWQREGWTGAAPGTSAAAAANVGTTEPQKREHRARRVEGDKETTMPVVEEELAVGKREVERGRVRIHSRVEQHPVEEQVRLREEKVTVERRRANRPATEADLKATEEETIEVTETAEVPVVDKRARVVEEVVVRKDVTEHTETVRDTARRKDVEVERDTRERTGTAHDTARRRDMDAGRTGAPPATTAPGFATYEADYRRHHGSMFIGSATTYEEYEPAYHYGYDLGVNERYRGRDWTALEADARRDWDARRPGTWERFKDAIRYGWDKVRR